MPSSSEHRAAIDHIDGAAIVLHPSPVILKTSRAAKGEMRSVAIATEKIEPTRAREADRRRSASPSARIVEQLGRAGMLPAPVQGWQRPV
jgi:hypothetical protein